MKFLYTLSVAVFVFSSTQASAVPKTGKATPVRDFQARLKVVTDKYILQQAREEFGTKSTPAEDPRCKPRIRDCVEAVCQNVGHFGCDDKEEILSVFKACRGNFNGACVRTSCRLLGSFDCDDQKEATAVAMACRGNFGDDCIKFVCGQLGHFGCDDLEEILEVANTCGGGQIPVAQK